MELLGVTKENLQLSTQVGPQLQGQTFEVVSALQRAVKVVRDMAAAEYTCVSQGIASIVELLEPLDATKALCERNSKDLRQSAKTW